MILGFDNLDKDMTARCLMTYIMAVLEAVKPSAKADVFMSGGGSPKHLILASRLNEITAIETDYPFRLANQGIALNLELVLKEIAPIMTIQDPLVFADKLEEIYPDDRVDIKSIDAPLMSSCDCYCCKNYSQAYLSHLMEVKELNALILIAIHNAT